MKINRENYEIYFVDYLDGKLNAADKEAVCQFISENPDLEKELANLEKMILEPEEVEFSGKKKMKKNEHSSENSEADDNKFVAYFEGDLSKNEAHAFYSKVQNNDKLKKEYKLFSKVFLKPDLSIVFPEKQKLKKQAKVISMRNMALTAASIAAALFFVFIIMKESGNNLPMQATTDPAIKQKSFDRPVINEKAFLYSQVNTEESNENAGKGNKNTAQSHVSSGQIKDKTTHSQKTVINENAVQYNNVARFQEEMPVRKIDHKQMAYIQSNAADIRLQLDHNHFSDPSGTPPVPGSNQTDEYMNVTEYLAREFKENVLKKDQPEKEKLTALDFLAAGLSGISSLTGKEISLNRKYDEKGNLQKLSLDTESFAFNLPVNKK